MNNSALFCDSHVQKRNPCMSILGVGMVDAWNRVSVRFSVFCLSQVCCRRIVGEPNKSTVKFNPRRIKQMILYARINSGFFSNCKVVTLVL